MAVQIQLRNDTAANWTAANPTLAVGEMGVETDTNQFKLGDGVTAWSSLSYGGVQGESGVVTASSPLSYDSQAQSISIDLSEYSLLTPAVNAKTANYTLTADDRGEFITCDGTFTITIPDATFNAGDRVDFVNIGTGVITFAGSGVTVNSVDSAVTIDTQYAGATFFFTSSTAGVLVGRLA